MSEQPKQRKKAAARQRLAEALRDNLKRRKAQMRGRKEETNEEGKDQARAKPHDSARIDAEK
jgi:hypothetical protein